MTTPSKSRAKRTPLAETKTAVLVRLLSRKKGATIADLVEATGWQAHSIRGAISGKLKKKMGLTIKSKPGTLGRTYRIEGKSTGGA